MDIEEAKSMLNRLTKDNISLTFQDEVEAIETVLTELEKKEAVINEMSNFINIMSNELVAETGDNNLEFCKTKKCIDNGEIDCKDCIKEYFTNKAENVGE